MHDVDLGRLRQRLSALGAVVTRVPAITDLDQDPCQLIRTGDWVRVDATHGLIEVKRVVPEPL